MNSMHDSSRNFAGLPLIRILGIRIILDYSWFIIFGLVFLSLAFSYFPSKLPGHPMIVYWILGFVAALLLFASVLAHELAHSITAQWCGIKINKITLFIFGGLAQLDREPENPSDEFRIAIAGPVISFIIGVICFGIALWSYRLHVLVDLAVVFYYVGSVNLLLFLFNLVPGMPLDGGRILRAFLWKKWKDIKRASRVSSSVGRYFGNFLIFIGVFYTVLINIVTGLWFIFIGIFLRQSANASFAATNFLETLRGIPIHKIMNTMPITIDAKTTLDQLVHYYLYHFHYTGYPVLKDNKPVGIINVNQVKKIPSEEWKYRVVEEVMTPIMQLPVFSPEDDSVEVVRRMTEGGTGIYPVVQNGNLVGIISRREIINLLRMMDKLGI